MIIGIASALGGRHALGDELGEPAPLVNYREPQKPKYLRLALEEVGVLGLGLAQYWYDRRTNSRDWQFDYSWASLRTRLEGGAYAFDTNGFDTNFLFHPTSGTLYYLTARSNRLSPFESLAVAVASSTLWEFFGEFQEKISVNDMVVTPMAGMAWGETSTQLGAFFLRACPSATNRFLGSTLAPFTAFHDAVDGADYAPACAPEPSDAHRFRFSLTGGEAWSEGQAAYPIARVALRTEVLHLPGFGRPGNGWFTFADGNVSRLGVAATLVNSNTQVSDFSLLTQTVVAGVHYRNNRFDRGRLLRREALFGLLVGAEYSRHRYYPAQSPDRIFLLDLPAVTARFYGRSREVGWELSLDAGGVFGGADSFALPRSLRESSPDVTSVAAAEGYNHVAGISLSPRLRVELDGAELGVELGSARMVAWRVLDRTGNASSTPVSEQRRRARFWIASRITGLVRFTLSTNWTQRSGTVGEIRTSKNELSLDAGIELAP